MVLDNGDEGVVCSVNTGADLRGESKLLVLPRVTPGDDGAPGDDARRGEGDAADGRSRRNVGVPRRRGVLADGCDVETGAGCTCAHETRTSTDRGCSAACPWWDPEGGSKLGESGGCYACQCAVCVGLDRFDANNYQPTDGKQCYEALKVSSPKEKVLRADAAHAYYVDTTVGLDYSNIDVRIVIEVWEGSITAFSSLGSDYAIAYPPVSSRPTLATTTTAAAAAATAGEGEGEEGEAPGDGTAPLATAPCSAVIKIARSS